MARKRELGIYRWLLLSMLTLVMITGCSSIVGKKTSSDNPSTNCRTVQHVMGETCVPLNPQRIITLDSAIFSNSLALDIKPIGAAMSEEDLNSSYLAGKTDGVAILHSSSGQFDLEGLLPLKPDLIVGSSSQQNQSLYSRLSQIAPTVLLPWKEISYDWKRSLQELAIALNKPAAQLINEYNKQVEEVKQALGSLSIGSQNNYQKIHAAFVFVASGDFRLALQNSFSGIILNDIGFATPLSKGANILSFPISEEYLPEINADILFVGANQAGDRPMLEQFQQKPLWSKIRAVQENQVYPVDFQAWYGVDILAAYAVLDDVKKHLINSP